MNTYGLGEDEVCCECNGVCSLSVKFDFFQEYSHGESNGAGYGDCTGNDIFFPTSELHMGIGIGTGYDEFVGYCSNPEDDDR